MRILNLVVALGVLGILTSACTKHDDPKLPSPKSGDGGGRAAVLPASIPKPKPSAIAVGHVTWVTDHKRSGEYWDNGTYSYSIPIVCGITDGALKCAQLHSREAPTIKEFPIPDSFEDPITHVFIDEQICASSKTMFRCWSYEVWENGDVHLNTIQTPLDLKGVYAYKKKFNGYDACAITSNNQMECWKKSSGPSGELKITRSDTSDKPIRDFVDDTNVIFDSGEVRNVQTGENSFNLQEKISQIWIADDFYCYTNRSYQFQCAGSDNSNGQITGPRDKGLTTARAAILMTSTGGCALPSNGDDFICWGGMPSPQPKLHDIWELKSEVTWDNPTCAISDEGVTCWSSEHSWFNPTGYRPFDN